MAKNIVNSGDSLVWTNGGSAVSAGDIVVVDGVLYVALVDIANGASGVIQTNVAVEAPMTNGAAIAAGETVNWDVSAGSFDDNAATPASGDVSGAAARAVAAGDDTNDLVQVKLTGVQGTVT